jgi:hypothetical protein
VSVWALPLWLNLGRLAATAAFRGARWLLLGPLTPEEEAGQWALFCEEGVGMMTLIGCIGLWLPDDSPLAVAVLLLLITLAFLALVATVAQHRMQRLLAGGAAAAGGNGGNGLIGFPRACWQVVAHGRLLGSLLLVQAAVVALLVATLLVASPAGESRLEVALWRFKVLLLFGRAGKKSLQGLAHYAAFAWATRLPRSPLWHAMVAKSASLATDAVEGAGVGLLFAFNLGTGQLSMSISDFIYAMVRNR